MDYNYVRMRDAASKGDAALAAKYRGLYEKGRSGADSHILNLVIALLLAVAVALGVYIAITGNKNAAVTEETQSAEEQPVGAEDQPDYVTRPDDGTEAEPETDAESENGENPQE